MKNPLLKATNVFNFIYINKPQLLTKYTILTVCIVISPNSTLFTFGNTLTIFIMMQCQWNTDRCATTLTFRIMDTCISMMRPSTFNIIRTDSTIKTFFYTGTLCLMINAFIIIRINSYPTFFTFR
jgi:hypothetical protein